MENHPKRVLIVEDDLVQQVILERIVTNLGHTVLAKVSEGAIAIKSALRLKTVDLILMDIGLRDDVDGIEAMNEIRKSTDVKVIYVTASTNPADFERAQKTDFVDFIQKPINQKRLISAFKKAFPEVVN